MRSAYSLRNRWFSCGWLALRENRNHNGRTRRHFPSRPPARSYRLLLALAKRQDHGDALLKEIRHNPTLKAKGNQPPRNTSLNISSADTGVDNSVSGSSLSVTTQKAKPCSHLEETDSRISASVPNIPPCNSQVAIYSVLRFQP